MRAVVRWGIVGVKSERGEGTRWQVGHGQKGRRKSGGGPWGGAGEGWTRRSVQIGTNR